MIEWMTALRSLGKRWADQATIDRRADERLLRLARAAGCLFFFIGLASVDEGFNRARISKTNPAHAFLLNLGYELSP